MNSLFFGGGLFPLKTFQKLHQLSKTKPTLIKSLSLISIPNNDSSSKEKNHIKDYARKHNIPYYQPTINTLYETVETINQINQVNIGIVCNYGYMIPDGVIDLFHQGLYVIHPSLLPELRGAAPIQRALIRGHKQTGVSIIEISKNKFDAGQILHQQQINIGDEDRFIELQESLAHVSSEMIEYALDNLTSLPRTTQDQAKVTTAPKIKKEQLLIDFNKQASKILNLYRGVYGTNFHSLKLDHKGKQLFIEKARLPNTEEIALLSEYSKAKNGSIWLLQGKYKKFLYIKCQDSWLVIQAFRFVDRGLVQESYTFKDQFMKEFKFDKDQEGVYYFN